MTLTWVSLASAGPRAVNEQVKLQLLAVNDFHGQLEPYSTALGGAALLGGYLDAREASATADKAITWRLGVGDLVGASPAVSALLQDEPTMQVFDALDFRYSTVGNHEFDEGPLELLRLQYGGYHPATGRWPGTHTQYLAANVVCEERGVPIFPAYAIDYVRGIPVGIIGVVYEGTPSIVTAAGTEGIDFLPEAETVNHYVDVLKDKGVETIIVLLHNGGSGTTSGGTVSGAIVPIVTEFDDEVDVVLSGHSHNRFWGYVDGKLVTGAHSAGRAFADVDLVLDRSTGDVVSRTAEIVPVSSAASIAPNVKVADIVARALAEVAPVVNTVIAHAASDMSRTQNAAGESELGNLIADAQRWKGATQVAFLNPGGIRTDLAAGEVTYGELFAIQPFSNYLVTMKMTGAQIEDVLERQWLGQPVDGIKMMQISGITYSWSASAPVGDRVAPGDIYIGGTMLDPTVTYTVTANSFLADGGDNFTTFRNATDKVVGGIDLDALIEYVVQLPQPFDVMIEGRAQLLP